MTDLILGLAEGVIATLLNGERDFADKEITPKATRKDIEASSNELASAQTDKNSRVAIKSNEPNKNWS